VASFSLAKKVCAYHKYEEERRAYAENRSFAENAKFVVKNLLH